MANALNIPINHFQAPLDVEDDEGPESLDGCFSSPSTDHSSGSSDLSQSNELNVDLVLALPAQHGPFMAEQIQEDQLVPEEDLRLDNMQVSMARTVISANLQYKPSPDTFHYWAKFFDQQGSQLPKVNVLDSWSNFVTTLLLSPTQFDWAKKFLVSQAWDFLHPHI